MSAGEKVWEIIVGPGKFGYPQRAYARVCFWPEPFGWILTDVEVPYGFYGRGHGRNLMAQALAWADEHGHDLCLTLAPTGPPDLDALEAWYRRCGFEWEDGIMRRRVSRDVTLKRTEISQDC